MEILCTVHYSMYFSAGTFFGEITQHRWVIPLAAEDVVPRNPTAPRREGPPTIILTDHFYGLFELPIHDAKKSNEVSQLPNCDSVILQRAKLQSEVKRSTHHMSCLPRKRVSKGIYYGDQSTGQTNFALPTWFLDVSVIGMADGLPSLASRGSRYQAYEFEVYRPLLSASACDPRRCHPPEVETALCTG